MWPKEITIVNVVAEVISWIVIGAAGVAFAGFLIVAVLNWYRSE